MQYENEGLVYWLFSSLQKKKKSHSNLDNLGYEHLS